MAIEFLFVQLNDLPDKRKGLNTSYEIREFVLAAFSVFFTQCPYIIPQKTSIVLIVIVVIIEMGLPLITISNLHATPSAVQSIIGTNLHRLI